MLSRRARGTAARVFGPVAEVLRRLGVTPNMVTLIGTAGVCLSALILYPLDQLFWGTVVITVFIFSDLLDGLLARSTGSASALGGFLDSTLDRLQDGSIFLGLLIWAFTVGDEPGIGVAAGACLVLGHLVSYVRAKAESLGFTADVGLAERTERLVVTLVFTGFTGLGLPTTVLLVVLCVLAAASAATVLQRILAVRSQAAELD